MYIIDKILFLFDITREYLLIYLFFFIEILELIIYKIAKNWRNEIYKFWNFINENEGNYCLYIRDIFKDNKSILEKF